MKEALEKLKKQAVEEIKNVGSLLELRNVKAKFLGKKGELTRILKGLKELPPEERPVLGRLVNEVKVLLERLVEEREKELKEEEKRRKLEAERVDITLPGRIPPLGALHPITQVAREIIDVFKGMGFDVAEGPEIETDYYNFEALNIPKDHPARDMQDTFYISDEMLLRTHTSPVQIRVMERYSPPIRIIAPGKVYRRDFDVSHTPMFHQIEGLLVGERVTFAELKGTLEEFAKRIFGEGTKVRFRPSYFPFTEPSAEMDIGCVICRGKGCRVCKGTGWLEILGCGMVDPEVFKAVGYDPEKIVGYAFGLGVERITMLKFSIDDIRLFFENDRRFLAQFS
ncbi:MAG: phenylalanine--tRNA ligase subunit alpha [Deferribacteres bacterium]|nr:phenylalanine--tRNA ligase subunit alpha [Deferribacteres bacterium]